MRVRVIKPEHLEAAAPRGAPRGEVILRIDEKARRTRRDVPRPHRLVDRRVQANEHPAALGWGLGARVRDDDVERRVANAES